ncbi:XRE family transcriptional regulator [Agrobacterium vitis]|uniref:LexA family transcriptional regulator n=1 Tax=Agrobacterium vitis TaxID=373 RepID=UPI0012E951FC|nr:LexA family transcriptional regulator [Agrobacterium vitis]MVA17448.1 XRE family transcriptional regulator [Agrobacterium vitis]
MSFSRNVIMVTKDTERFPHRQRNSFRLTEKQNADSIPLMTESIQQRISKLIQSTGKGPQWVSKEIGLDKETLPKLLRKPDQVPSMRTIAALAKFFDVTEQFIMHGKVGDEVQALKEQDAGQPEVSSVQATTSIPQTMAMDVPVMGTAAGSLVRGAFKLEPGVVDYVRRPPALMGARDIYALYVEGSSMEPQFFPGDLIYLNPHRPARAGDVVVVQSKTSDHIDVEASLGIFLRKTENHVIIGKHNPAKSEVSLPREFVVSIHRVLSVNELLSS